MKKAISLILIFTMLLTLAACGKKEDVPASETPETAPVTETVEAAESATAPAVEETLPPPLYGEVLDSYYDALLQGKDADAYIEAGMNYLPGLEKDINKIGYYLEDVNSDGTPELLIGAVGEPEVYAMYTAVGGNVTMVVDAGERNVFWMDSDGMFINRGSNSAASSGYLLFNFDGTSLNFQDALIFDANANAENPWFYAVDQDWDVANDTPIDSDEAEQIVQQLEDSKLQIPYVAFAEYKN